MFNSSVDLWTWSSAIDLWTLDKLKQMLSSLAYLVWECGNTKVASANKTKKKQGHWDAVHEATVDNVKSAIAKDAEWDYTDHLQVFEIYPDISHFQLGAVILQNSRSQTLSIGNCKQHRRNTLWPNKNYWSLWKYWKSSKAWYEVAMLQYTLIMKKIMWDCLGLGLTSDWVYLKTTCRRILSHHHKHNKRHS